MEYESRNQMNTLLAPLKELAEFEEGKALLDGKEAACLAYSGCGDAQRYHMLWGLGTGYDYKVIVTYSDLRAREIAQEYAFYDPGVVLYPAKDLIFYQADINGNQLTEERLTVLRRMIEGRPMTVVTTFAALMTPQVPLEELSDAVLRIALEDEVNLEELARGLVRLGYERTYQVESVGQFSIRGGIVDIFALTEENPFRIELWGDEVDSIRSFDLLSQRSVEALGQVEIYPATELLMTPGQREAGLRRIEKEAKAQTERMRRSFLTEEAARLKRQTEELIEQARSFPQAVNLEGYIHYFYTETESFLQFFPKRSTCVFVDEPVRVCEHASAVETEFRESMSHRLEKGYILPGQADVCYGFERTAALLDGFRTVSFSTLDGKSRLRRADRRFEVTSRGIAPYNNSFDTLSQDLAKQKKQGGRVLLLCASRTRAKRLAKDLMDEGLNAFYSDRFDHELLPGEVMLGYGQLKKGFEYPLIRFSVISESDIFDTGRKKKSRTRPRYEGERILDFGSLKVGDYVVHVSHGLGIYQGIEKVEVGGTVKDYIKISYRDGGNLFVLATALDQIQKYASADTDRKPRLNKLGTQEWTKTKAKVRGAVDVVAKDLVELYAARGQQKGYVFTQDTVWQREFEECFPFEETEDQKKAIEDTKRDMESTRIMDRLICGDVGYGKTEIALRAAFKAVQDSKQVAVLVPTTVLAQQHYNTFVQRMKDFPVRVDLLSRFRTAAEQKKTIRDLKKGQVDILIGTHRILSQDVEFKDLGLLVVDEEQRFGVTHKEKIKKLKENVDVLTLTATPIPRTLHMSLVGIRDMSVLEEPPGERLPIQTFVCEYDDELVREAVVRELGRGGQVYYVYNRVANIADEAAKLKELVPEAEIAYAHGQMKETDLERIMYDFVNGQIDVLVSTTIIETGLDIPNVNTILIRDSDRLGLSQLYQLRGRVGRSSRNAYAFLMYQRDKILPEVAEKRLTAIREFADLGSGYKIAMRDLEIRGAGNLLGKRQSGHMDAVGYDLYCRMLQDALKERQGLPVEEEYSTSVELDVDAYIPASYIVNEQQKLDIYKRISGVETGEEYEDMKDELRDRFGEVPRPVDNLLRIALLKTAAHRLYVLSLKGRGGELKLEMKPDARLRTENIPQLINRHRQELTFMPRGAPYFLLKYPTGGTDEGEAQRVLKLAEGLIHEMEELLLEEAPV